MYVIICFYGSASQMRRELGYSNKKLACLVYSDVRDRDGDQVPFISNYEEAKILLEEMQDKWPDGRFVIKKLIDI